MLDIRRVRSNPQEVLAALKKRHSDLELEDFLALDEKRRQLLVDVEALKNKRNTVSEQIGKMKKAGQDAEPLMLQMRDVNQEIKEKDEILRNLEENIQATLCRMPNIPHSSVPVGKNEQDNQEVRRWGTPRQISFRAKPHWELGEELDILDFERGGKVTGARFTFYKGLGARLERALINFMLDTHAQNGYTEIFPPFIVNKNSMFGTGQLPKFAEDMFKLEGLDYYLIPTAEVRVTNLHRDEIFDARELPKYYCAYSACFRAEAGAAGRDTRGLIRQHQFNKVELVKFVHPENSYRELESLTNDAERILQALGLPYRVVCLCSGDLGFSAAKTYDIEVWFPSFNTYREISSCSNFEDFQARRSDIKFRPAPKAKAEFVHTLNGSGLAIGRTVSAILENYQQEDGSVLVPEVLRPYMRVDAIEKSNEG